jgi:hypothetical protein
MGRLIVKWLWGDISADFCLFISICEGAGTDQNTQNDESLS